MSELNPTVLAEIEARERTAEMEQHLVWSSVAKTHIGRVRYRNEDAYFNSEDQTLWAVADGMGGHSRGEFASAAVVRALNNFAKQGGLLQRLNSFEMLIESAHTKCRDAFRNKQIGTTVAALFAYGCSCFYLWAGDSRVYRLRNGKLKRLTRDHTVAEDEISHGRLSEEEARNHPSSHVLTRAIGVHPDVKLEISYDSVEPGDRYLVCSDGLYNGLSDEDVQRAMMDPSGEVGLTKLIDLALDLGGKDNITGIMVEPLFVMNEDDSSALD